MLARADRLPVLPPTQLLIGGEWGESAQRKRFVTINPATEDVITDVSEATASDFTDLVPGMVQVSHPVVLR